MAKRYKRPVFTPYEMAMNTGRAALRGVLVTIVELPGGMYAGGYFERIDGELEWDGCDHPPHVRRQDALRCAEIRLRYSTERDPGS